MKLFKIFLGLQLLASVALTMYSIFGLSIWNGFNDQIKSMIPNIFIHCNLLVVPFTAFCYLLIYFILSNLSIKLNIERKK